MSKLKQTLWPNQNHREDRLQHRYTNNVVKRKNAFKKAREITRWRTKWRIGGVLIPIMILNIAGRSGAQDITTSMLASLLGYPLTCVANGEARSCVLSLACWLRGGVRAPGCGGWLMTCCVTGQGGYGATSGGYSVANSGGSGGYGVATNGGYSVSDSDGFENSIPSSEWKYKPPRARLPARGVPPTAFRRRVDDDVSQMECGLPGSRMPMKRIIGGREARRAEFPWQAHVRISEFQCGGVLVSRRFVATAAHCVSRAPAAAVAVWLGALEPAAGDAGASERGVTQKILHPLFQFRVTQPDRYDIALLRLSHPVVYSSHILPICLPSWNLDLRGRSGVIAGWGKTDASSGHTGTNRLRSATVPLLSTEQCIKWHQSKQISVEIHSEMICAGHSDGHQDACLGDSGGPLIVMDSNRYYLVGITSAGFGCGVDHQPGIYHNVKLTTPWIKHVISEQNGVNYY